MTLLYKEWGVRAIEFFKKHGSVISNVLVVILVLGAIYVKTQEEGARALFKFEDIYIIVGALLALVLLRFWGKRHEKQPDREKSGKKKR